MTLNGLYEEIEDVVCRETAGEAAETLRLLRAVLGARSDGSLKASQSNPLATHRIRSKHADRPVFVNIV